MKRRDFLRSSGWFVVGAALSGVPGCGDNDVFTPDPGPDTNDPPGTFTYPQGIASGDPRAGSVVLWTRILKRNSTAAILVLVQVAEDADFRNLVVSQIVRAAPESDHTVRVLVTGLAADTGYYYRFRAGADAITGQTRTAPEADADVQINVAWVSCQDSG